MCSGPEPNEIHECPACHAKVVVRADYGCPSCGCDMRSVPDDGLRRITVDDGAILPPICAHCGAPADAYRSLVPSRTLDDGGLHWFWRWLATLVLDMRMPRGLKGRAQVKITVDVPYCGGCRDRPQLRPQHVRFFEGQMTLLVHQRLRAAVDELAGTPPVRAS